MLSLPRAKALIFRVIGHVALALIEITLPGVGSNRYWVAGLLVCVGSPIAILLNLYVRELSRNWVEALLDLIMVVTLLHLVPHLWMVAMVLGLMVALAPSISLHPSSHWIYMAFGVVLLAGVTFAATLHEQTGWLLPVAAGRCRRGDVPVDALLHLHPNAARKRTARACSADARDDGVGG